MAQMQVFKEMQIKPTVQSFLKNTQFLYSHLEFLNSYFALLPYNVPDGNAESQVGGPINKNGFTPQCILSLQTQNVRSNLHSSSG